MTALASGVVTLRCDGWSGISGSAAYDCKACPARAALPKVESTEPSDAAARGVVIHTFCQKTVEKPANREKNLAEITNDEWRETCAGINFDAALDGIIVKSCEISYALNVKERTCRLIGTNINRKYNEHLLANGEAPLSYFEIPFTIDLEGESVELKIPVELDYKSGWTIGEVAAHGQRKIHSAGLMFYYGTESAISRVAYVRPDGAIDHDGHEFDIFDAYQTCDDLLEMLEAVKAAREELAAGRIPTVYANREEQCRYCPSFSFCPYWTNLARAAGGYLSELPDIKELKPEEAGPILDKVKDILHVAEEIEKKLRERALKERLVVDEKWEYSAKDQKGRSFEDTAALRGALVKLALRGGEPMTEEEAAEMMASFRKEGSPISVVKKRKRLDVVQEKTTKTKLKKVG